MRWISAAARRLIFPLVALFATLWLAAQTTVTPASNQPPPNATPATPPVTASSAPAVERAPLVMIDAAHGGAESGAILNPAVVEKDVTLAIARRLRQELGVRGVQAQLLRDGDAMMTTDRRATLVNAARPALYVTIHATSQGSGIRIYSALLPAGRDDRGPFVDWERAQSHSLGRSRILQQQLTDAIRKMKFPARALPAAVRPLNNIGVPALAIEIAPTTGDVSQLATPDYQQMVSAALANAIAGQRSTLETAP